MIFRRYRIILAAVSIFLTLTLLLSPVLTQVEMSENTSEIGIEELVDRDSLLIPSQTEETNIENPVWLHTYGPNQAHNRIRDTIECSDGGFCMLGELSNPNDVAYLPDAILLKTDSNGNHIWNQTYGRDDLVYESVNNVIECTNGDYVFVGKQHILSGSTQLGWLVRTNSTGHLKYNITYPSSTSLVRITELSNGDLFVSGAYYSNIFIMRTDENGTEIWSWTLATALAVEVTDMIEYSSGIFIIGGYSYDSIPDVNIPFLLKIDQDGVFSWIKHYTVLGVVYCFSLLKLDSGGVLMTGSADSHLWFGEVDANGVFIHELRFPNEPSGVDIIHLEDGGYAVATSFYRITLVDEQFEPTGMISYDLVAVNSFVKTENNEFVIGGVLRISNNYTLALLREPWLRWNHSATDIQAEYLQPISRDFNATCSQGVDAWTVNATSFFDIDSNGVLTNNSVLDVGIYPITVMVNDTLENTLIQEFLVMVEDTTSPEWIQIPENQQLELGTAFSYDLNAFDSSGVSEWSLNASGLFDINAAGLITNIQPLEVGSYGLMVTAEDIYSNALTGEFSLTVSDSVGPAWIITPSDVTVTEGQDIEVNIAATDLSGIDSWTCNDTVNFQIEIDSTHDAGSCLITNAIALDVGTYGLNLTVTDPYGNKISSTFTVTIIEVPVVTTTTTTTTTETTSTTTTSQTSEQIPQTILLVGAVSGWGVAVLVIVVMMKRRT